MGDHCTSCDGCGVTYATGIDHDCVEAGTSLEPGDLDRWDSGLGDYDGACDAYRGARAEVLRLRQHIEDTRPWTGPLADEFGLR